jgi:protoporphyrin/coproporphyrin ferrochelatase
MTIARNAVLLIAHGSPDKVEDIPEFLRLVTGGRGVPESVVKEIEHRYSLIGCSPLTCHTTGQANGVHRETGLPTYIGMRNWHPFIPDTLERMRNDGVEHAVAICLAPQNSRTSVGLYKKVLEEKKVPFTIDFVESWHDHPLLIRAFAENHQAGYAVACSEAGMDLPTLFTAHSVPQRTITEGDPYESQARETAALVAHKLGLDEKQWHFAFQSQGMSGGGWLGPTVEETLQQLADEGKTGVFFQPIGFVCDHVEILYDIDIAFREFAGKLGIKIWRAESLNNSVPFAQAIADIVRTRLAKVPSESTPQNV